MAASEQDINFGICREPNVPRSFKGRGGVWACENCNKTKLLSKGTKMWKCEQCQMENWTIPLNECPVEKARRFIMKQREVHAKNQCEKNKEEQQQPQQQAAGDSSAGEASAPAPAT